jgi:glycosyltransferase involved in cell wall biosynthesis
MSAAPPVSICLVTYNRDKLLSLTLNSILTQSFADYELIISDDCSTDNTREICYEYAKCDPRIRYLRNDVNLGIPSNLNVSLQAASGRYLANLHDGDVFRIDLIAKWKEALDTYPTAGFVFNAYRTFKSDGSEIIFRESYPPLIDGKELGRRLLSRWDSCVFGTVMARREVYERLGWFDPRFGNFSDIDMWLRISREYDVAYINEPLMDLMPKDPTRFYSFVHWKVLFWLMGIHTSNLQRYRVILPEPAYKLSKEYAWRRRKFLMINMLVCLKHCRWDRVREGFAIWRDADDRVLRTLGRLLGRTEDAPDWYDTDYWEMARLSKQ